MNMFRPKPDCILHVFEESGDRLVTLGGLLRLQNCEEVKNRVMRLLEMPARDFYIDLSGLHEIDSAGLGLLVGLHMSARRLKVPLYLVAPTPFQLRLFESTRLNTVLHLLLDHDAQELRTRMVRDENSVPEPAAEPNP
jgi:anti-anti-sigma factor